PMVAGKRRAVTDLFRPQRAGFFSVPSFGTTSEVGSPSGSSVRGGLPAEENLCLLSGSTPRIATRISLRFAGVAEAVARPAIQLRARELISPDQAGGSSGGVQVALVSVHRGAVTPSFRAQVGALVWAPVGA